MKELHCLHDISRLLENEEEPVEARFQQVVDRLPGGFQRPEATVVRLTFGGHCYLSGALTETKPTIGVSLPIPDEPEGCLEAFFCSAGAEHVDGAFLEEETTLLTVVKEQIRHVLERHHALEQLRKSRAQLAKVQHLAQLGSWEWHVASGALVWTEETYRIFGLDPDETVTYARFLGCIHPDDRESVDATVRAAVEKLSPYQIDHRIIRTDNSLRYVHEEGEVIFDDDGKPTRMMGIVQDITSRKHSEEALRHSYAELKSAHQRLKEMNAQLIQSEKMASIGQLAAGVAHEINNPVGYISANVGSLQSYLTDLWELIQAYEAAEPAIMDENRQQTIRALKQHIDVDFLREDFGALIRETREGVQRVKGIVQDLKDFSRTEEDSWQWTDLHKGIDSTLNIVWNELKYKTEVIKEYGKLPEVECMPSQLNQVIMNLLINAGHAIEERGTITIRTGQRDDQVWISVRDTGKGISRENLSRLFEPFFTTKPVGQGTGLGLALSFGIVQKHGGRIEVESEPGKGSLFTVWLPVEQSRPKIR